MAQNRIAGFRELSNMLRSDQPDPEQDETTTYLFWDGEGKLIGQLPEQSFSTDTALLFKAAPMGETIMTVTIGKHGFRVFEFPNVRQNRGSIVTIGIVRSLDDANSTLRTLLWDICSVIIAGVIISILAGRFLAGRALIPIRNSWDKQQRFVADASHELRTPNAVIHAQTEMLLRQPDHTIEQESAHIALILKESKRMNKLLDDLLTLARSDSNQLLIHRAAVPLGSLIREIVEQFRLLTSIRDVDLSAELQEPLTLWGDEGRIRQLLFILLDNALKYTASSGRIVITARSEGQLVYISVTDNGKGIADEDLPYLFERFYRGDKARSRAEGGTGLGLSIAQWIMNAHDGSIRIDSKLGEGTKVELLFPRRAR
ncbi:sensor histidine kinase [Paenibacillus sp. MWE-103]|uniref:histidine kinase n=1 Tax=Paenibacillus artemisiicola TaxID=1172618 RepID=A0ABS3W667_9BACL|nr:ATP-binding protein [Paenibacillus artemisiicola]MBO7743778.1 sensor histidine kinase [Paenibacillus artemisiicola]